MLPACFRYPAAQALVRAQLSSLLTAGEWEELLDAEGIRGVADRLGRTRCAAELVPLLQEESASRDNEIRAVFASRGRRPLTFLGGNAFKLLDWYWRRLEVENLKLMIRLATGVLSVDEVAHCLVPLGEQSAVDWDALKETRSLSALIQQLGESPQARIYAAALDRAAERFKKESELFYLDVALDLTFDRRLLALLGRLSGRDLRQGRRLIESMIGMQNLLAVFRYRFYFNLSPEEILGYTIQNLQTLRPEQLERVSRGESPFQLAREIWGDEEGEPARAERGGQTEEAPLRLETLLLRRLNRLARESLAGYPFHLGVILAFQILLEHEAADLIRLIRGKAHDLDRDAIAIQLIGRAAA